MIALVQLREVARHLQDDATVAGPVQVEICSAQGDKVVGSIQ